MVQSEEVLQGSGIASVATNYHNGINRLIRENEAWWSAAVGVEADFGVIVQATLLVAQELMGRKAAELAVLRPRIIHFASTLDVAFTTATALENHYQKIQSLDNVSIVHHFGATISATLTQLRNHLERLDDETLTQTPHESHKTDTAEEDDTEEETHDHEPFSAEGSIASIFSDASNPGLKDHLDFESDYIALAAVIAYRKFQPPLAVGLFGNWGSGKSFFMSKLQGEIRKLTDTTSPTYDDNYCERIVQINFNSWHYSDSNLWASLITKIFEDLEKCGTKDEEKSQLETLFNNLSSSRELKQESEKELRKVEKEIEKLIEQHTVVEGEIALQVQNLETMNTLDIVKAVLTDDEVKKDIAELKEKYDFVRSDTLEDIRKNLNALETTRGKLVESFKILYSHRKGDLWIALITAVVVFIGSSYLVNKVEIIHEWFAELRLLIVPILVGFSQALLYFKRGVPYVDELHRRLLSLKKKTDELEIRERNKFNVHRDDIQRKIDHAQLLANTLKEKVKALELKVAEAEHEMNTIASGKKMIGFIEGRVTDQRYVNSLGIISWIRKDFEELDFLLKQQHDARKLRDVLDQDKIKDVFKVDRIVLYIDDLDRCDVSVVVRVLEAIHLLLAFPLFVVVVGVDPRWMHNALQQKYKDFLATGDAERSAELREMANLGQPATSFDYLEKIFQIPFVLKPIDVKGKRKLIEANLTDDHYDTIPDIQFHHIIPSLAKNTEALEDLADGSTDIPASGTPATPLTEFEITAGKERRALSSLVTVSDEEIAFMQCLSFLVGDSPRTIKRYVNIYRLIRAHARFRFIDTNRSEHYYAAMVVLGVLTNFPDNAPQFFAYLRRQKDSTLFGKAMQDYTDIHRDQPFSKNCWNEVPPEATQILKAISLHKFKINLDLISRFSFRNITE